MLVLTCMTCSFCSRNFWQLVREYTEEQKKRLLAFITGSDRIPVGGLAKLKLVIVKNGPDSNRYYCVFACVHGSTLCVSPGYPLHTHASMLSCCASIPVNRSSRSD